MRTRREDDRLNDVRAVDCDACGDEGYTRQSGGEIDEFTGSETESISLCESCQREFGHEGLEFEHFEQEGDVKITPEWFAQLLHYVNEERAERGGEPMKFK